MKYSQMFGVTEKNAPSDLKAISHKLLHQAGFIRQVAAGRYAFLPLGYRVWQKIMDVVQSEMEEIGSQRILTPNLHPIEIWKSTNRDAAFGDEMYILEDHHGSTFALGATAEGLMVELVKGFNLSYKNLPTYIHQFSNKFRDEKRPKGGLLRVREFMMKDAYSFDKTEEDLLKTYQSFYDSYLRIAKRLDLEVVPVLADSGAIGGDYNHEFIVLSESGEGEALRCDHCDYAAHIERADSAYEDVDQDVEMKEVKEYEDEHAVTCEVLAENMGIPLKQTTKTILFSSNKGFIAAMVRGDYDISESKLKRHLGIDVLELASSEEVKKLTGAKVGFAGPIGLSGKVKVIADKTCQNRINFEVGGNKTGIHLYNVNYERDMPMPEFADIRESQAGDVCASCGEGKLQTMVGIEWGHCFKQDLFYTKPHKGTYVDDKGEDQLLWMGAYGIGLGRSMATIVETHHDDRGIVWPDSVAPYQVYLIDLGGHDSKIKDQAESLYKKLNSFGIEVLWDDRDVSPGKKFANADLIGIPVRLVISSRNEGKIEYKRRDSEEVLLLTQDELMEKLS